MKHFILCVYRMACSNNKFFNYTPHQIYDPLRNLFSPSKNGGVVLYKTMYNGYFKTSKEKPMNEKNFLMQHIMLACCCIPYIMEMQLWCTYTYIVKRQIKRLGEEKWCIYKWGGSMTEHNLHSTRALWFQIKLHSSFSARFFHSWGFIWRHALRHCRTANMASSTQQSYCLII